MASLSSSDDVSSKETKKFNLVGFHVSRGADMLVNLDSYRKLGFRHFQIFINNPRRNAPPSKVSARGKQVLKTIADYIKEHGLHLYVHAPYTINLSNAYHKSAHWITTLRHVLELAQEVGARAVVVHTGRAKDLEPAIAIANMVANISFVLETAKCPDVQLFIETPSGQGSEIGWELEELSIIWNKIPAALRKKMGICVDTCHIYAAGYDIKRRTGVRDWMLKFQRLIGLKHLKLVHLNDSKRECNSHVDRHAVLGHGLIADDLRIIARELHRHKVPLIVETPGLLSNDMKLLKQWL